MLIDDLLTYVSDGRPHLLAEPLAGWLASSRRFAAFVTTFRDKIRKKIRATQDRESILDLWLELETAHALHAERTLSVQYEPKHPGQGRCPDFAVSFTTSLTFMVEVTRLRPEAGEPAAARTAERLADVVCGKLGQLLPQHSNVVVVGVEAAGLGLPDVRAAMLRVQQRAEANDQTLFGRHHFRDRADFFHHQQRLSEIIVRGPAPRSGEPLVWANPQARHPLPAKARTALHRSLAG
ncbi:MAG TPA: hypothetical protein VD886_26165 [Herpetosiphonaceae bacterium]|nr:hypothetical protein [Herpetosiphonaceae bacterium]